MTKTEIKKELYKQKPDADFSYEKGGFKIYSCELEINGNFEIVEFKIPLNECEFGEVVPAQLLIRWLV